MKKGTSLLLTITILSLSFLGCDFFVNPDTDDGGETVESLSETISSFPTPKLQLTKSLQLDSGDDATRTLQSRTIETVDDSSLPSVYSEQWYDMQQDLKPDSSMTFLLDILKNYAKENEISDGEIIEFGEIDFNPQDNGDPKYLDAGKAIAYRTSSGLKLYWFFYYPEDSLYDGSSEILIHLYLNIKKSDNKYIVELKGHNIEGGGALERISYLAYDEVDKKSALVVDFKRDTENDADRDWQINRSYPNGDGSYSLEMKSTNNDGSSNSSVGWSGEEMGGFGDSMRKEFYGDSGELVYIKDDDLGSYIYPLFQLLPFTSGNENYTLNQEESTTESYEDYYTGQTYNYTTYNFSIQDGVGDEVTETNGPLRGRMSMNIDTETGGVTGVFYEPVWEATEENHASLPDYFDFGETNQNIINDVTSKLQTVTTSVADLDLSDYSEKIEELKNKSEYDQLRY